VQRVSYTGDLGFEIYCSQDKQFNLWEILWSAGTEFDIKPFGMRAMMSLRLDKFFGSWLSEFSPDYTPAETGLDKFINFKKDYDFIGRSAAYSEHINGCERKLCIFEVDADDADVVGYEPISLQNKVVGFCTSGGFSHHTGKSIAFGFLPSSEINESTEVQIEIMGRQKIAKILTRPIFDSDNSKMRN
jgi:dimethylglycine dehydrogenase